jgi:hypothetical protein
MLSTGDRPRFFFICVNLCDRRARSLDLGLQMTQIDADNPIWFEAKSSSHDGLLIHRMQARTFFGSPTRKRGALAIGSAGSRLGSAPRLRVLKLR